MPKIRAENIDAHKEQTRAAILDAAQVVLAREGYESMRRGDVADLAGVARTTVYSYFATNEELIVALAEDRAESILASVLDGREHSSGDAIDDILTLVGGCLEYAAKNGDDAALFLSVARSMPNEVTSRIWELLARIPTEIDRLIGVGVAGGSIDGENREGLALALGELVMGGVDQLLRVDDPVAALDEIVCSRLAVIRRLLEG